MRSLHDHSIALILEHQAPSGAYIAAPSFPTYAYSWFRDGSFIAHAMDRAGHPASAASFHRWCGGVIERYAAKIDGLLARHARGEPIALGEQLHTRYTLDGHESGADWTNFQLDGYGTWLWALADHVRRTGDAALYHELQPAVRRLARYLAAFWQQPCYDCWEEHAEEVHTATLAALYGGLNAIAALDPEAVASELPAAIRAFIVDHCVVDGALVKFLGNPAVDASLLGVAVPYGVLAVDDPRVEATVTAIERDLRSGGLHRYRADTYYGGGSWVLLAAWLGWYYAERGLPERAAELAAWVAAQADADGLPEQVSATLLAPEHLQPWTERWGSSARPLLWSHAMYLILEDVRTPHVTEGVSR